MTNGVPIETVSKLLGHTSIKTTQIYAKIVEEKICSDMHNLRKTLNQNQIGNDSNPGKKQKRLSNLGK
uniref:hypothetical protein n=1 Tax=Marinilabilia salmonicolor TaxID=989 RepID=UPI001F39028F